MSKSILPLKRLFNKLILPYLYNKYVSHDPVMQEDVEQTFKVRGCKTKADSIEKKFKHLMIYYPEFALIFLWRIKGEKKFYASWFTQNFSCKIFRSTKIEGGLVCFHPFASVLNAKSIGKNFQFRNCLTIGNKNNDNNSLPVIGNDVTVGVNVSIIGDIRIGDNVTIGAGSVVVKDVPSNVIIGGNPARIIREISAKA